MGEPTADVALLTPVPSQHLESGLSVCTETGFVAFGTGSGMVLSEFRLAVDKGHPADTLFYASESSRVGPAAATYRGRFAGYDGAVSGRAKKHWANHRPPTTEHDGAWQSFYLVSDLRKLDTPIVLTTLTKLGAAGKLSKAFIPLGPLIIDTPF
jgi:hypothetical protein